MKANEAAANGYLPLAEVEKVQQFVRISAQGSVGQAAKGFVVEVLVDPVNLTPGRLFDNPIWHRTWLLAGL